MGVRGEHNVGQLAREHFGAAAYLVGFGTPAGTVAAANDWDGGMEVMDVRPSHPKSYERLCHDAGTPRFRLPLREPSDPEVRRQLMDERLERAIGVIYRPDTELMSHYFRATLPRQFDEYVWLDETHAVTPRRRVPLEGGTPETFPFGV
jgi:protein-L-isoaspartate(D-aspartate) O-methyltransferase